MTNTYTLGITDEIIPYQELLGNYDILSWKTSGITIIPYQELLGNYDLLTFLVLEGLIIPYQELLGNYDQHHSADERVLNYTIPRAIREL